MKIAAIADIHIGGHDPSSLAPILNQINEEADVLCICGDLTDRGSQAQADTLLQQLTISSIPIISVFGNHDYEEGQDSYLRQKLLDANIHVLDGDSFEIEGVGFAGVKGFGGGYDRYLLSPWGEAAIKLFVKEAVDEMLKLEKALTSLNTDKKVALLHYSPITATLDGEAPEIFPFLGCSRLENPLNNHRVTFAVHGHAHGGSHKGKTSTGIDVFNVSLPLMLKQFPKKPYLIHEI